MSAHPLDDLLSPLGAAAFFATHWERAPLHLSGDPSRGDALLTHAQFADALSSQDGLPLGVVAFPEHFAAAADTAHLLSDRALLDAYLAAGHPVVWNRARGVWPSVDALTATLADAFGAQVWPNVYATGTAGTPFDTHFDTHEVIALQCAGEKRWSISEVRVNRPLDAADMESTISHELRARRDEAAAHTLATFTARPGDVVYIPRGQFHNASATAGRSLHVTFGIRIPTAFDALQVIASDALGDPMLREYLPPRAADPDGARTAVEVERAVARLREAITVERVGAALGSLRAEMAQRSKARASKQR